MEIYATAKLVYWNGEAVSAGWERLELIVKFKENGKIRRRKLTKELVSTYQVVNAYFSMNPLNSFDEYYTECEKYLNDTYLIKKAADKMIKDYFNKKNKDELKYNKSKNIQDRVSKQRELDIKVIIK